MRCGECKRGFPPELLSPMFVQGGYTPPICGICALELRNKVHGIPPGVEFQGEIAQEMYEKALRHIGKGKK